MTETNGNDKKQINYHGNVDAAELIPQHKRLVTNIGAFRGAEDRFEIYFLIPETDEECQTRYDCDLAYLLSAGIRQLTTRVDYPSVGFEEETGELKEDGHEAMQTLADGYRVGAKRVGTSVKKKAAKLDSIQKEAQDLDMDDPDALAAYVKRIQKSGGSV